MPRVRARLSGQALADFNRTHPRGPDGRFLGGAARQRLASKPNAASPSPAAPTTPPAAPRTRRGRAAASIAAATPPITSLDAWLSGPPAPPPARRGRGRAASAMATTPAPPAQPSGGRHRSRAASALFPESLAPKASERQTPTPEPDAFRLEDIPEREQRIGWLLPSSDRDAREELIAKTVTAKLDGEYAGLQVKVDSVVPSKDLMVVSASIFDRKGNQVGETERVFRRDRDGTLWVYHAFLSLRPNVQGQGFAEAWNGKLMDWYSESGLDRIEVTANIDVGGYTWARQGFDFKGQAQQADIKQRLEREMSRNTEKYTAEQVIEVNAILARLALPFDHDDRPTAYEVSQVGRLPGQGKRERWPGKKAMLGSYWAGVKPVPKPGTGQVP